MVLIGHGDLDKLVYHSDWPVPEPGPNDVLIKVAACGMNNTDVNTRSGWYSKAVSEATTGSAYHTVDEDDPTWGGAPNCIPKNSGSRCLWSCGGGRGKRRWLNHWQARYNRQLVERLGQPDELGLHGLFWLRVRWRIRRIYNH